MTEQQRDLILKDIEMGGNIMSQEIKDLLPSNEDREMIKLTIKLYQKKFETKLYHQIGIVAQKKDVVNYTNYYSIVKKYELDSNIYQPIYKAFYIDKDGVVHNLMKGEKING